MLRVSIASIVLAVSFGATLASSPVLAQCPPIQPSCGTLLGIQFQLKGSDPYKRQMKLKGAEKASALTFTGDPIANGADVELVTFGPGGLQSQCVHLDAGPEWRGASFGDVAKYLFRTKLGGPVRALQIVSKGPGLPFGILIKADAKTAALDLTPPNPGTYAGVIITIGGGGGQYAVNFGGTSGGVFARNDDQMLKISKPSSAGACPDPNATCGDGIVSAPFETCEVGSPNSLCADADCGSHGLPCLCPFCGDGVAGPNSEALPPTTEECDHNDLQACTEGCSRQCTCAVCGDGTVQGPIEDCDIGASDPDATCDTSSGSTCLDDGNPNVRGPLECICSGVCGDGIRNQFSEECDSGDQGVCGPNVECIPAGDPGGNACKCGFCGDGYVDTPTEACDGADDGSCPGACQADCTCGPFCGDGVMNGSEQCDPPNDANCSGLCQADCTCP